MNAKSTNPQNDGHSGRPKKGPPQPPHDAPLSCGLTPDEIYDLASSFETGFTGRDSYLVGQEEFVLWKNSARNSRTGNSCTLTSLEYVQRHNDDREEMMASYVVEMNMSGSFVTLMWETSLEAEASAQREHIYKAACETYFKLGALIGLRLGYVPGVLPPEC